jgi:hypothetical protein
MFAPYSRRTDLNGRGAAMPAWGNPPADHHPSPSFTTGSQVDGLLLVEGWSGSIPDSCACHFSWLFPRD